MLYNWHLLGTVRRFQNVWAARIRKELDDSNGDYEGKVAQKYHSDRSDEKRTTKFIGEIQVIIDNNPSMSIRSIDRHMGVSESLIRQLVHEDIRYAAQKMRKGHFLSLTIKNKRKDRAAKLFNKLISLQTDTFNL